MQKFIRLLDIKTLTANNSLFLFGPGGTGKSFLRRETLRQEALIINLLQSSTYLRLAQDPCLLEGMIAASTMPLVVIDEIQKLPLLLDEVQGLMEEKNTRFLLTGSSARKLKRGKANLLAARARLCTLYPLAYKEFLHFDFGSYLLWGGLSDLQHAEDK